MNNLGENLMFELLEYALNEHSISHYKPSWLNGLEIDRYYPSLRLSFEFQGNQHTEYSFSMHTSHDDFLKQIDNDRKKKNILSSKKICLIEVFPEDLMPNVFFKKLSCYLMDDFSLFSTQVDQKLINKIKRYQIGLPIYYKKKRNRLIHELNINSFIEFFHTQEYVNDEESFILLLLYRLSKDSEVLLTFKQLNETFPTLSLNPILELTKKKLVNVHPVYGLISLNDDAIRLVKEFDKNHTNSNV